jgi:hypothetical protein
VGAAVGQPDLEVLDVVTTHSRDRVQASTGDHPVGELAQRVLGNIDAARCLKRGQALQVTPHRGSDLRSGGLDLGPLGGGR